MDIQSAFYELLRAIRKQKSQTKLSAALGYSFNQVYRWESGQTKIGWSEFVKLCGVCKVPLAQIMNRYMGYQKPLADDLSLLKYVVASHKPSEIIKNMEISKFTFSRWMNGKTSVSAIDMFKMIFHCTNCLPEIFLSLAGSASKLPTIHNELQKREKERQVSYDTPIAAALVRCIELEEYSKLKQHNDEFVAKKLALSTQEVRELFKKLIDAGLVAWKDKKLKPTNKSLSTVSDPVGDINLKIFWLEQQIEALKEARDNGGKMAPSCHAGHLIFTTNEMTYQKIRDSYFAFRQTLLNYLHADDNHGNLDRVLCHTIDFIDLTRAR